MDKAKSAALDIAEFENSVQDTAELTILHPVTFEPTDMKITLYTADSDVWRKELMRLRRENAKYENRRDGVPPEKRDSDSVNILVAMTVGWTGINENGSPLPFTKENARRVYANPKLRFIREQVDEFIGDRQNFIRK